MGGYALASVGGPVGRVVRSVLGRDHPRPRGSRPAELLFRQMPPGEVTMLGDSLTSLGEWSRLLPGVDVGNRGIGGETSAGLRARIGSGEPVGRTAFILIGINDEAEGIDEAETQDNLRAVVQALNGRRIFLQSTLPRATPGDTERVNRLAAFERRLCATGACRFVDLRPSLAPAGVLPAAYSTDGTHLSWSAYQAWGAIVRRSLSGASPPPAASDRPAAARPRG